MTKRNKIIYWIATVWASLGMASSAVVQLIGIKEEIVMFQHLGYPDYLMKLIGVAKIFGVVTILIPKFPVLKEWAYAGMFFTMLGGAVSHLVMGDPFADTFPCIFLMVLLMTSWYFRPDSRKVISVNG